MRSYIIVYHCILLVYLLSILTAVRVQSVETSRAGVVEADRSLLELEAAGLVVTTLVGDTGSVLGS